MPTSAILKHSWNFRIVYDFSHLFRIFRISLFLTLWMTFDSKGNPIRSTERSKNIKKIKGRKRRKQTNQNTPRTKTQHQDIERIEVQKLNCFKWQCKTMTMRTEKLIINTLSKSETLDDWIWNIFTLRCGSIFAKFPFGLHEWNRARKMFIFIIINCCISKTPPIRFDTFSISPSKSGRENKKKNVF